MNGKQDGCTVQDPLFEESIGIIRNKKDFYQQFCNNIRKNIKKSETFFVSLFFVHFANTADPCPASIPGRNCHAHYLLL